MLAKLLQLANRTHAAPRADDLPGAIPQPLELTRITPIPKAKEFAKANKSATPPVLLKVWNRVTILRIEAALEATMHKDRGAHTVCGVHTSIPTTRDIRHFQGAMTAARGRPQLASHLTTRSKGCWIEQMNIIEQQR